MAACRVAICNLTRGTTLADRAECARGPWRRLIGLLGRATFSSGAGLIFAPCTGLHTIGMRFPIDLVYLRRTEFGEQGAVVLRLQSGFRPCRVALTRADLVLELPSGTIVATGTAVGDRINMEPSMEDGARRRCCGTVARAHDPATSLWLGTCVREPRRAAMLHYRLAVDGIARRCREE